MKKQSPTSTKTELVETEPDTTPKQIALDLFLSIQGSKKKTPIESVNKEIGFRRNNLFLNISKVSLLCRRLLDVAYFIVAQPENEENLHKLKTNLTYTVDLNFFKWLMGYNSRNNSHLKELMDEAQTSLLTVLKDTSDARKVQDWASTQLLGESSVSNGVLTFAVSEGLAKLIKNPSRSHFLSLRFKFESLNTRLLFDMVSSFQSSDDTDWIALNDLREQLECNTVTYEEWRYFNRMLKKSIEEINKKSNINVEMETRTEKESRKIGFVRFHIEEKKTSIPSTISHLKELYIELKDEFGLSDRQLAELTPYNDTEKGLQRITRAMEYTRYQIESKGVTVKAPASYLMTAIEKGLVVGKLERKQSLLFTENSDVEDIELGNITEEDIEAENLRAKQGLGFLGFMNETKKKETIKRFLQNGQVFDLLKQLKLTPQTLTVEQVIEHPELSHQLGLFIVDEATKSLSGQN